MSSVNITVAIEGAPVYGLGAYEPTCTPLATPLAPKSEACTNWPQGAVIIHLVLLDVPGFRKQTVHENFVRTIYKSILTVLKLIIITSRVL